MQKELNAIFSPRRFAHANLFVAELAESLSFYHDVCGITEVFREPGIKAGFLSNGATHHDVGLMEISSGPLIGKDGNVQNAMTRGSRPGLNHIAFQVDTEEELVNGFIEAAHRGVSVEKALDHGISRSVYLLDPDGNAVELYADIVGDWRGFYADHQNELISAHWRPLEAQVAAPFEQLPRESTRVDGAALSPAEICGATLITHDLAVAMQFYLDVCGLRLLAESHDERVALLALPGSPAPCLALVCAEKDEAPGLHSLWFLNDAKAPAAAPRDGEAKAIETVQTPLGQRSFTLDPNNIALAFYHGVGSLPVAPLREEVLVPLTHALN